VFLKEEHCCSWRWHSRTHADRDSSRNAYLSRNVHSIQLERSSELHRVSYAPEIHKPDAIRHISEEVRRLGYRFAQIC